MGGGGCHKTGGKKRKAIRTESNSRSPNLYLNSRIKTQKPTEQRHNQKRQTVSSPPAERLPTPNQRTKAPPKIQQRTTQKTDHQPLLRHIPFYQAGSHRSGGRGTAPAESSSATILVGRGKGRGVLRYIPKNGNLERQEKNDPGRPPTTIDLTGKAKQKRRQKRRTFPKPKIIPRAHPEHQQKSQFLGVF